jgi:hypothetical protein
MAETGKPCSDLTAEKLERLQKYCSVGFKSAGATRQR